MNKILTNKLYVLSGVPSVGKSTFISNLEKNGITKDCIISTDEIRKNILGSNKYYDEYGAYESLSQEGNDLVFKIVESTLEFRMKEGLTTFLDATAINDSARATHIKIANKYNMDSEVLIFDRDIDEIKESNKNREKRVPDSVIDKFYNEFEKTSTFNYRVLNPFDEFEIVNKYEIDKDVELFVVGDVHGLYEDLEKLLSKEGFIIDSNTIYHTNPNKKLLFVGDIVDRGYDSIKVLELIKNSVKFQGHYMVLGNHDYKLVRNYENFTNGLNTSLFKQSEAVSRTFVEFINLPKDKQAELFNFLNELPHYHIYRDNLIVHANIRIANPLKLTKQQAIFGCDSALCDAVYTKLYKEGHEDNKYKLIRGHIPIIGETGIKVVATNEHLDLNDTSAVISLEDGAVSRGNLLMYDVINERLIAQKTDFDYNKNLSVYDGRKLIKSLEDLEKFKLETPRGIKETKLVSYKHNDTETLRIYKYDKKVFFNNLWHLDPLLLKSRGLVLDSNGQIVQHPFTKVFNYNENGSGLDIDNDKVVIASVKENGFLGCITKWNGDLLITTTGSFDSDFTNYIKDFIINKEFEHYDNKLYGNLMKFLNNNDLTLMFEVIHPNDPHIIKYEKDEMGLRLIGARGKNINDKELSESELDTIATKINVKRPEWFEMKYGELKDLVKKSNLEGYMVRSKESNEILLKFKTPYYLTTKFIGRMSVANIKFMYSAPDRFKQNVDEEYYSLVDTITKNVSFDKFLSLDNNDRINLVRDLINKERDSLENTTTLEREDRAR